MQTNHTYISSTSTPPTIYIHLNDPNYRPPHLCHPKNPLQSPSSINQPLAGAGTAITLIGCTNPKNSCKSAQFLIAHHATAPITAADAGELESEEALSADGLAEDEDA